MKKTSKLLFYPILLMSTLLVMSSTNYLSAWIGLEMNLMAFIPIMIESKTPLNSESCMMYFLTQSMGSIMYMAAVLTTLHLYTTKLLMHTIILMSMAIKMGMLPFHMWLPEIMNKMEWQKCLIIMTWQKVAPLMITSTLTPNMLTLMITISVMTGAIGGLNQTSLRKIMAYSSMAHMGWMLMCMLTNNNMWMLYLTIYSIIIMAMIMTFKYTMTMHINQINTTNTPMIYKMNMTALFVSLGGLPPFLGFLPKWMVIQYLIEMNMHWMLLIMMMMSLMTMFYYLRMINTTMMFNLTTMKWMTKLHSTPLSGIMLTLNMSLPLMSLINIY